MYASTIASGSGSGVDSAAAAAAAAAAAGLASAGAEASTVASCNWLGESIGVWDREANTLSTALNVYDYVNPWDDWVDAPNSYTTSNYFCSAKRTEVAARSTGRCRGRR